MAERKCKPVEFEVALIEVTESGRKTVTDKTETVVGCQHNYVSKALPLSTGQNMTVTQQLGIDYGVEGALENHPIPAGT
ncbi:MAG: hypothetical protein ACHQUA_00465 [Microgenomates group bacterium]